MPHPLIDQLRFTRSEFLRGIKGVKQEEARQRLLPMNCISWNVGHLAWQEQRYFLLYPQGQMPYPEIDQEFRYGAPASMPPLKETLAAWRDITHIADPWLDGVTSDALQKNVVRDGKPTTYLYGSLLQRVIYHY
jgi:DinB superfamily